MKKILLLLTYFNIFGIVFASQKLAVPPEIHALLKPYLANLHKPLENFFIDLGEGAANTSFIQNIANMGGNCGNVTICIIKRIVTGDTNISPELYADVDASEMTSLIAKLGEIAKIDFILGKNKLTDTAAQNLTSLLRSLYTQGDESISESVKQQNLFNLRKIKEEVNTRFENRHSLESTISALMERLREGQVAALLTSGYTIDENTGDKSDKKVGHMSVVIKLNGELYHIPSMEEFIQPLKDWEISYKKILNPPKTPVRIEEIFQGLLANSSMMTNTVTPNLTIDTAFIQESIKSYKDAAISATKQQLSIYPEDSPEHQNILAYFEELNNMTLEDYTQYYEDIFNKSPYENIILRFTTIALDVFVDTKSLSKAN